MAACRQERALCEMITLEEANEHLRLDLQMSEESPPEFIDARVPNVQMKITLAEAIVLNYLKIHQPHDPDASPQVWTESDYAVVKSCVLLVLSALFDDAEGRTVGDYMAAGGTIPLLLARLRDPAIA